MSTPIRAKFIEHMEFLGLAKQTQRSYINGVKGLAKYHNQSPEKLTRRPSAVVFSASSFRAKINTIIMWIIPVRHYVFLQTSL